MSTTIELEVGDLYANLHEQFKEQVGPQYEGQARQEIEEFLHNFNQQVERQMEQMEQQSADEDEFDLTEEDIEDVESSAE